MGPGTFNQSGSSLLTVSHDYTNSAGGTFNSTGGTIQFTGSGSGGADFSTGTNQFFNMIINSGVYPKFSNIVPCNIKVAGDFTNNNSSLDCLTAEFIFNGTSGQTISSACNPVPEKNTFGKLTIDNPGTVTLLTNVEANISFTLIQGELDLNGNILYVNGEEYSGPVPVELVSFNARISGTKVILNWLTATEVNNYGFEVERAVVSSNSEIQSPEFEKIGFVSGCGNTNSPKDYSFIDEGINYGNFAYRLKQIDTDGTYEYSEEIEIDAGEIPNDFVLEQNYPNPFNPSTTIRFAINESVPTSLKIYDVLGNEVEELFNKQTETGKVDNLEFNAVNLPSGVYFYKLETPAKILHRKMLLIK